MSKIGKQPITVPSGVTVEIVPGEVRITGPRGTLIRKVPAGLLIKFDSGVITVEPKSESKHVRALFGTIRSILANNVTGVSTGWKKQLELVGTGYRAETTGKSLTVNIGFSHPVKFEAPEGVSFTVEKSMITIEGPDREIVGQVAATIRAVRPPEPYQGKGIKYTGEVVRRKAGKAAKTAGVA